MGQSCLESPNGVSTCFKWHSPHEPSYGIHPMSLPMAFTPRELIMLCHQDKPPKASPKKRSIMEHSPGLPQDTKSLRSCSENRPKMLLNILASNVTPNIMRSWDSFSTVPPIVNGGDWECIVRDLETIIVLVLLVFNFTISFQKGHTT